MRTTGDPIGRTNVSKRAMQVLRVKRICVFCVFCIFCGSLIFGVQTADLVIAGGIVVTMDGERRVLNPGSVAIRGRTIVAVDTVERIERDYQAKDVIDARTQVVMPGLINTHTHAPMVLYRGLGDDLALMDWLQKYIFPAEAKTVSPAFVRTGTELAALEMIRSGTTTYVDMYYFEEEIARATKRAGLRGVLGQTIIEFPVADAKTPAEALKRAEAFIREFQKDELITPAVAPHAVYTNDAATLTQSRDLAAKYDVPLIIHLAETEAETGMSLERHKARPVAALDAIGFFKAPVVIAAHGVWIEPHEIQLLQQRGVGVSHNPESNMKLASGTAPVPGYLKAGLALGLGTDGAASNNDMDMFEAMRQAAFLHKLTSRDPQMVSARTALEMATIGGARVIGREQDLGSLEAGKLADVLVVRMDQPRQTPMYEPVSHLVYTTRGDDVDTTIVNGRVLMRSGTVLTLDQAQVLAAARAAAAQVRAAVQP
ncbi:MAG TPA: amidohydrolase [Vicinamibacterales bacterium]|nr:amidohydrolase [Vicinamibacterales bacterium]